jgi:hypothetical protein
MQAAFATAPTPPARSSRLYTTEEHGHGREEQRTVQVLPARDALSAAQLAVWLGVLSIVMVTRVVWCEATGEESLEVSYFLSSLSRFNFLLSWQGRSRNGPHTAIPLL